MGWETSCLKKEPNFFNVAPYLESVSHSPTLSERLALANAARGAYEPDDFADNRIHPDQSRRDVLYHTIRL
jgi:hypothetical protein